MPAERPIIISTPEINTTTQGSFFLKDSFWPQRLEQNLRNRNITPASHTRALELFAGRGPVAYTLRSLGWSDITCIDYKQSPNPIAPADTHWIYLNLSEIIQRQKTGGSLEEIAALAHTYDIVTATFAINEKDRPFERPEIQALCGFFTQENGYIFTSTDPPDFLE